MLILGYNEDRKPYDLLDIDESSLGVNRYVFLDEGRSGNKTW